MFALYEYEMRMRIMKEIAMAETLGTVHTHTHTHTHR